MTGQAPTAITSTTCGIRGEALYGKPMVEITITTKTTTMIATAMTATTILATKQHKTTTS